MGRHTYTYSTLEINKPAFEHIVRMLRKAGRHYVSRYVGASHSGQKMIHFPGSEVALVLKPKRK